MIVQKSTTDDEDNSLYRHHLVWLDQHLNTFTNKRILKRFNELDQYVKAFDCENQCLEYIHQQNDRNSTSYIIFIVSGTLSDKIIPKIQDCICILAIFIFCHNVEQYEHIKYRKFRAVCDDIDDLIRRISLCIQRDSNKTDFSFFYDQKSTTSAYSNDQYPIRNLKEDQARFLWFYHCHNHMLKLDNNDDRDAKAEMIAHALQESTDRQTLSSIDEFNRQSLSDNAKSAIRWYTEDTFIYKCTNKILRKENISQIYLYRYIIKLLCYQLQENYEQFIEQYRKIEKKSSLDLYRGQYLNLTEIQLLKTNINHLISLNGFISTTRNRKTAMTFIKNRVIEGLTPVLIKIDVNMTNEHKIAFADISHMSQYSDENEVLFSIGAVFRIQSVEFDVQNGLYLVHLSLNSHDQLSVNLYIEETYANHVESEDRTVLFGKLLCDMGEYEFARTYFSGILKRTSNMNNQLRAMYLNNIGICYCELDRKDEALEYYKEAFEIYKQTENKHGIGGCFHNIASIHYTRGNHRKAIHFALKAYDLRQKDKIEKASTLNLLGCIRLAGSELDAAHDNLLEALKLRIKYLGRINSFHPDIGISYQNLGNVDFKNYNYIDAERNYSRAEEIFRHNFPPSYPLITEINKCLKETRRKFT